MRELCLNIVAVLGISLTSTPVFADTPPNRQFINNKAKSQAIESKSLERADSQNMTPSPHNQKRFKKESIPKNHKLKNIKTLMKHMPAMKGLD